jgi:hypothetical protein
MILKPTEMHDFGNVRTLVLTNASDKEAGCSITEADFSNPKRVLANSTVRIDCHCNDVKVENTGKMDLDISTQGQC